MDYILMVMVNPIAPVSDIAVRARAIVVLVSAFIAIASLQAVLYTEFNYTYRQANSANIFTKYKTKIKIQVI
jgi:hypothetical protein